MKKLIYIVFFITAFCQGQIINSYAYTAVGGPVSVTDSFNRTDSATLGTADTGEVWNSNAGTGVFGILNNQAYMSTPYSNSYAILETGITDLSVQCTAIYSGGEWGLVARWVDKTNWLKIVMADNYWIRIRKRVANVETNITSVGFSPFPSGTVVRVDIVGDSVSVYWDDVLKATGNLAGAGVSTGTKVGISSNAATGNYWEDFSVTEIK